MENVTVIYIWNGNKKMTWQR